MISARGFLLLSGLILIHFLEDDMVSATGLVSFAFAVAENGVGVGGMFSLLLCSPSRQAMAVAVASINPTR